MTQAQTIAALKGLVPQIKAAGAAEPVIIKYAEAHDLSPAQLEKMAQVWNIIRTNNFMDKSASDRGASFEILDVPAMVGKYCESHPVKQSRRLPQGLQDWIDMPDGLTETSMKIASHRGPDLMHTDLMPRENLLEKTASALNAPLADKPTLHAKVAQMEHGAKQALQRNLDTLLDLGMPACWRLSSNLRKFASHMKVVGVDRAPEIEFDMRAYFPGNDVEDACKLAWAVAFPKVEFKSASVPPPINTEPASLPKLPAPGGVPDPEKNKTPVSVAPNFPEGKKSATTLVRDRHGVKAAVATILEDALFLDSVLATAQDLAKEAGAATAPAHRPRMMSALQNQKQQAEIDGLKKEKADRDKADTEVKAKTPFDVFKSEMDTYNGAPKPEVPKETDRLPGEEAVDAIPGLVNPIFDSISTRSKETQNTMSRLLGVMVRPTHKLQAAKDNAANDIKDTSNLQRLLMSDPILSEADPETVVNVYNSIRETNPALAHDIGALRFALREAVQFEGLPLHTLKDVGGMHKDKMQAQLAQKQREAGKPAGAIA